MKTDNVYIYATVNAPEFGIFLGDKPEDYVKAVNGILTLTEAQNETLKKLRPNRPDIAQHIRELDIDAAEKMAREHMARQRPQAHQGARHSQAGNQHAAGIAPVEIVTPPGAGNNLAARLKGQRESVLAPNQEQPNVPFHVIETDAVHNDDLVDATPSNQPS